MKDYQISFNITLQFLNKPRYSFSQNINDLNRQVSTISQLMQLSVKA